MTTRPTYIPGDVDATPIEGDPAQVFLQWKGTDACLDLHCPCGVGSHFDGDFAYVVQCAACGAQYEMPDYVYPRRVQANRAEPVVTKLAENPIKPVRRSRSPEADQPD